MGTGVTGPVTYAFVGGSGRSGTTITAEIFARRSDVARPKETRFITDPDGVVDFYNALSAGQWSPTLYSVKVRRLARLLRRVGKHTYVQAAWVRALREARITTALPFVVVPAYGEIALARICPDYDRLVAALLAELVEFKFAARWVGSGLFESTSLVYRAPFAEGELRRVLGAFVGGVLDGIAAARGARAVVEDTPWTFLWFDKILELLPGARLVHIYRDPRDVVASFMTQQWSPSDPAHAAQWYCGLMQQWRRVRARLPRGAYLEVSLENLVASSERVLREIAAFWDLPWDEVVLGGDLTRSHAGRWRRDLGEADQRRVSTILAEELTAYGYA